MLNVWSALTCLQYYTTLEKQKMRRFIQKQFEAEKYIETYWEIFNYVTGLVSDDPEAGSINNCFESWVTERFATLFILC